MMSECSLAHLEWVVVVVEVHILITCAEFTGGGSDAIF
jgi:hypothetical protein